jgi:GNAT superfamily N-acetyltransferase
MPIIELKTKEDFAPAFALVKQQNPGITRKIFDARLKKMLPQGYRCIAWKEKNAYLGLCGFWTGTRFWCGNFIDLDNVIVDAKVRSKGIGKKLVAWVEKEARKLGCDQMGLDAYTTSHAAHRFYFREGYIIKGYHFIKPLAS